MTPPTRIAWFTPLPPIKSGISRYCAELLPALSSDRQLDVFVDGPPAAFVAPDTRVRLFDALDFVWMNRRQPYELIVYQLGNAPCHDYMWAYLVRYPGLVVLHDAQLHHARGRALLQRKRYDDYRSEFWFNHPDAAADLAELGAAGLLGSLTTFLPMLRVVFESAGHIAVHNKWLAGQLRETFPSAGVSVVEMGVPACNARADARIGIRRRYGIPMDGVLFVAFGKVTPEKRIVEAIRGLAAMSEAVPDAHVLLAGETVDYYEPISIARDLGVQSRVSVAGFVSDEEVDDYLAAADVCLCMRWPTSRETSASYLRCLAAGRATVTTDLVHTVDIPTLDTRSGAVLGPGQPAGVSVDILDEPHSLNLAMRRLAQDSRLRDALGRQARELWESRFSLDQMIGGYRTLLDVAATASPPIDERRRQLPVHLLADGREHGARVLLDAGFPDSVVEGYLDTRS
jgi:glycosyltransferase involved in cell wall biosynthesis